MLKTTRMAALAAALFVAAFTAVVPLAAQAQTPPPSAPAANAQPAAPAAPTAATTAPKTKTTELVDNPYGLEALLKGSDIVARVTLAILAIMSMGSWYIIITKVYEQYKMGKHARAAEKTFWSAPSVQKGVEGLKKTSPFRFLAETGIEATHKHGGLLTNVDMNEWITMSIQRAIDNVQSRSQDGLAFLATVGSTAPFVGLFGTVWGIMNSFIGISKAQTTNLAVVAPGIAEALLATAIGLFAAIPAVIIYNQFTRSIARYRALVGDASAEVLRLVSRDLDRGEGQVRLAKAAE
jgi:biopolymer transport protein ExbB